MPHDHGSGWVIYAVQHGEMEMGSYTRVTDTNGAVRLVQRDVSRVSKDVLMLRLTSCDLSVEDREGRMTRYVLDASPPAAP